METTEKVIILKTGKFRENDLWVKFLSSSRGIQTAFAFGGVRSRKRFSGCLEPFSQVLFKIETNKTGTYQALKEGSLLKNFSNIRGDFQKQGLLANCFKFVEAVAFDKESGREIYHLLDEVTEVIDKNDPDEFFPLFFRAKIAFSLGFNPDFTICSQCVKPLFGSRPVVFDIQKGVVMCLDCDTGAYGRQIKSATARVLAWIQDTGPEHWKKIDLPAEIRQECFSVIDQFMAYHLGIVFEGTNYRRV